MNLGACWCACWPSKAIHCGMCPGRQACAHGCQGRDLHTMWAYGHTHTQAYRGTCEKCQFVIFKACIICEATNAPMQQVQGLQCVQRLQVWGSSLAPRICESLVTGSHHVNGLPCPCQGGHLRALGALGPRCIDYRGTAVGQRTARPQLSQIAPNSSIADHAYHVVAHWM